ncbi:hypothetical protein D3C84_506890 [compost metagenome]
MSTVMRSDWPVMWFRHGESRCEQGRQVLERYPQCQGHLRSCTRGSLLQATGVAP